LVRGGQKGPHNRLYNNRSHISRRYDKRILPGYNNAGKYYYWRLCADREKTESFVRGTFERAAEANGYPKALLKAMVTMQIEVYRVKNVESGEYEFFETDDLPTDPNKYDIDNKERIVKDNELLTLTASQAENYKIASAVVKDRAGALDFLTKRDGVTFEASQSCFRPHGLRRWSDGFIHPPSWVCLL
jgi:hypothetical protein